MKDNKLSTHLFFARKESQTKRTDRQLTTTLVQILKFNRLNVIHKLQTKPIDEYRVYDEHLIKT